MPLYDVYMFENAYACILLTQKSFSEPQIDMKPNLIAMELIFPVFVVHDGEPVL